MNTSNSLFRVLLVMVVLSVPAAAQLMSLSQMSALDKFTSADGGFTISLPAGWVRTTQIDTARERGARFVWAVKEGVVLVTFRELIDGTSIDTDAERASFVKGFKEGLLRDKSHTIISEAPVTAGAFRGMSYSGLSGSNRSRSTVYMLGKRTLIIMGLGRSGTVAGADELIFKALDSIRLTAAPAAPKP